jgi:spore coat protein U-like protein
VRGSIRAGAFLFCLVLAGRAHAACTVSATGVNFGNYDAFVATPRDSTGSVTVVCTQRREQNVVVTIGASATSGGFFPRMMKHSSRPDRLNYNVYTNSSRSSIWGDGTAGTTTVRLRRVRRNRPIRTTIYGRIPPGQNVSSGTYSDRLTVTVMP